MISYVCWVNIDLFALCTNTNAVRWISICKCSKNLKYTYSIIKHTQTCYSKLFCSSMCALLLYDVVGVRIKKYSALIYVVCVELAISG